MMLQFMLLFDRDEIPMIVMRDQHANAGYAMRVSMLALIDLTSSKSSLLYVH